MTDRAYIVYQNDHDEATLSTSQTEPVGFEVENTQNIIRDDEWRSPNLTTQTLTGTWDASKTVNHFSIHGHGLYGASVRFQCGAYDSGTIAVEDFTAPAIVPSDYTDSDGSSDPYAHLMSFFLDFDDASDTDYTITFSGTPRDYAYFWASRIWVGRAQWLEHTATFGSTVDWQTQTKKGRTFGGSQRPNRGEGWRVLSLDFNALKLDKESSVIKDMKRRVDTGGDLIINPFAGAGTRDERDSVFAGTLASANPLVMNMARWATKFQLEEN